MTGNSPGPVSASTVDLPFGANDALLAAIGVPRAAPLLSPQIDRKSRARAADPGPAALSGGDPLAGSGLADKLEQSVTDSCEQLGLRHDGGLRDI
jgi:hypothetical protein